MWVSLAYGACSRVQGWKSIRPERTLLGFHRLVRTPWLCTSSEPPPSEGQTQCTWDRGLRSLRAAQWGWAHPVKIGADAMTLKEGGSRIENSWTLVRRTRIL